MRKPISVSSRLVAGVFSSLCAAFCMVSNSLALTLAKPEPAKRFQLLKDRLVGRFLKSFLGQRLRRVTLADGGHEPLIGEFLLLANVPESKLGSFMKALG